MDLARKVRGLYQQIQPPDLDPMTDFDERDLLRFAAGAGFKEIHLELEIKILPHESTDWEQLYRIARNPKIPTLEEDLAQVLTPGEAQRFIEHLRPLVEAGQGIHRSALAFLWAVK